MIRIGVIIKRTVTHKKACATNHSPKYPKFPKRSKFLNHPKRPKYSKYPKLPVYPKFSKFPTTPLVKSPYVEYIDKDFHLSKPTSLFSEICKVNERGIYCWKFLFDKSIPLHRKLAIIIVRSVVFFIVYTVLMSMSLATIHVINS